LSDHNQSDIEIAASLITRSSSILELSLRRAVTVRQEVKVTHRFEFKGKHAVITGGSSGIGLAIAEELGRRGAVISIVARSADRLSAAAARLADQGVSVHTASVDVAEKEAVAAAFATLTRTAGPCDILVTSAGQARPGYFLDIPDEFFKRLINVDYFGTLWAIRAVVPDMVAREQGTIVAISSAVGLVGVFGYTAYSPAKFAVRGLMESLRAELLRYNIHVACVYPPDVDTAQLAEENQWKPGETTAVSGTIKPLSPHQVARSVIRGIDRRKFAIYPDFQTHALGRLAGVIEPVLTRFMDRRVRRYQAQP
jgi:3-dehydrosphinganine reductase